MEWAIYSMLNGPIFWGIFSFVFSNTSAWETPLHLRHGELQVEHFLYNEPNLRGTNSRHHCYPCMLLYSVTLAPHGTRKPGLIHIETLYCHVDIWNWMNRTTVVVSYALIIIVVVGPQITSIPDVQVALPSLKKVPSIHFVSSSRAIWKQQRIYRSHPMLAAALLL